FAVVVADVDDAGIGTFERVRAGALTEPGENRQIGGPANGPQVGPGGPWYEHGLGAAVLGIARSVRAVDLDDDGDAVTFGDRLAETSRVHGRRRPERPCSCKCFVTLSAVFGDPGAGVFSLRSNRGGGWVNLTNGPEIGEPNQRPRAALRRRSDARRVLGLGKPRSRTGSD